MAREIGPADMPAIATGAAVLGSGGGGDPYIGMLLAQRAMERAGRPVRLIDPAELACDDLVIPAAGMGAPTVSIEKFDNGRELVAAFQSLEQTMGRRATAVMSIEAGGGNSTAPFLVAAELGLPLVDCDGMGRAFPELQMVTMTIYGIPATPMAMADEKGNTLVLDCVDNRWAERLARSATIEMGCVSHIALFAMTGRQVRESAVAGTISLCQAIGVAIGLAHREKTDPVAAVAAVTGGCRLFSGKVSDVRRATVTGFARGEAWVEGTEGRLQVMFQNEHLLARLDSGRVLCSTPDLIVMLDAETGLPVTTEALRYGFRVAVLGIPCDRRWRTPAGLDLVGPRYFGYDFDYVPVEELADGIRAGA